MPGQRLVDYSSELFTAMCNNEWYKASIKTQKQLLLILQRSQRPMVLSAVGLYDMTFDTLTKVKKLFTHVKADWKALQSENEIEVMAKYAAMGYFYGKVYVVYMMFGVLGSGLLTFGPLILDIVRPANVSRAQLIYMEAGYLINAEKLYYLITLHMQSVITAGVVAAVSSDVLYISMTFHACGMYNVLSYSGYWYEAPVPTQKLLLFIMQRTLKPQIIDAMGIFDMTLKFFSAINTMMAMQWQFRIILRLLPFALFPVISGLKYSTCWINTAVVKKLFTYIKSDWNALQSENEIQVMAKYAAMGYFYGKVYVVYVIFGVLGFITVSFVPLILDVVMPANVSRVQLIYLAAGYSTDMEKHYCLIILHLQSVVIAGGVAAASSDVLYISMTFHACGMYNVASYSGYWYEAPVPTQKLILFIMQRTLKPQIIGAVGIFDMTFKFLSAVKKLFMYIKSDWNALQSENEIQVMAKYAAMGYFYGKVYVVYVIFGVLGFITVSFVPLILDVVMPANVSRVQLIYLAAGYSTDMEKHYCLIILHLQSVIMAGGVAAVSSDVLYISMTFHACGMYNVVRFRLQHLFDDAKNGNSFRNDTVFRRRIFHAIDYHLQCLE
ncbi:hypothetical protein KM043_007905 [Ampulex compressa]|nr:hypothetical protein KM043_007905 [Ampulex compressa]